MIVYAVYILTKNGLELISEKFQSEDSIPNSTLLSALLVAFQQMAESVTAIGIPRKITFDELTYHVKSFGAIQVIIATNSDKEPTKLLTKLGYQFMFKFDMDFNMWNGNQSIFESFRKEIKSITSELATIDVVGTIKPHKMLDQWAYISIPKKYQIIAGAVNVRSSTLDELFEYLELAPEEIIEGLEYLKTEGYIGTRLNDGMEQYFTLAGERS